MVLLRFGKAIIEAIQGETDIPKGRVSGKSPDAKQKLPYVFVECSGFSVNDMGLGGSVGGEGVTAAEVFNGDGKNRVYTLKEKFMRPLLSVETPKGSRVHQSKYIVDYIAGTVTLDVPPKEGEGNVVISYRKPFESKGITLDLKYQITSYGGDEEARDTLATSVMGALLKAESSLNGQGIYLKLVRGFNTSEVPDGTYGKTVEYSVEGELRVDIPVPRIESIDLPKPRRT